MIIYVTPKKVYLCFLCFFNLFSLHAVFFFNFMVLLSPDDFFSKYLSVTLSYCQTDLDPDQD